MLETLLTSPCLPVLGLVVGLAAQDRDSLALSFWWWRSDETAANRINVIETYLIGCPEIRKPKNRFGDNGHPSTNEASAVITSGGVLMRDSASNLLGSARLSGFDFIRFINQLRPEMMTPHQLFGTFVAAAMDIGWDFIVSCMRRQSRPSQVKLLLPKFYRYRTRKYNNTALFGGGCWVSLTGRFHRHSAAGWAGCTVAGPGRARRHAAQFSERSSTPLIGHARVALSGVPTRLPSAHTDETQRGGKGHKLLPAP